MRGQGNFVEVINFICFLMSLLELTSIVRKFEYDSNGKLTDRRTGKGFN